MLDDEAPGRGHADALAAAYDQRHADLALELGDLPGYGRLCEVQCHGGRREGAPLTDFPECLDETKVHNSMFGLCIFIVLALILCRGHTLPVNSKSGEREAR